MPTFTIQAYPGHFRAIKVGDRTTELLEDWGFQEGDRIVYQEWDSAERCFTGDELAVLVTSVERAGPVSTVPRGFARMVVAPILLPVLVPGDLVEERKRRDAVGAEKL